MSWYETDPGLPNDTEVLFLALLRVQDAASAAEAAEWAAAVLRSAAAVALERAGRRQDSQEPNGSRWGGGHRRFVSRCTEFLPSYPPARLAWSLSGPPHLLNNVPNN